LIRRRDSTWQTARSADDSDVHAACGHKRLPSTGSTASRLFCTALSPTNAADYQRPAWRQRVQANHWGYRRFIMPDQRVSTFIQHMPANIANDRRSPTRADHNTTAARYRSGGCCVKQTKGVGAPIL
jgi:hypothetical protein